MTLKKDLYMKWASQYSSVAEIWLPKYKNKKVRIQRAQQMMEYCKWTKLTPPELLALKEQDGHKAELMLNRFYNVSEFTEAVKFNMVNAVKSFYKSNFKELHENTVKVQYPEPEHNRLDKGVLRRLYRACWNPRDRALLQFVCSTAAAKFTVVNSKWKHFEKGWQTMEIPHLMFPSKIIKGRGMGKYQGVKQATFLTTQAKLDMIEYKQWYEKNYLGRQFKPEENIFWSIRRNEDGEYVPLSYTRLGSLIVELRTKADVDFTTHDGRRWVETALENNGVVSNWARRIRGRKVTGSESPYSQPKIEQLREKYRGALQDLEFLPRAKEDIIDDAVASAMDKLKRLMDDPALSAEKKREAREYLQNLTAKVRKSVHKKTEKPTNGNYIY